MVVSDLKIGTVILPRAESPSVISRLIEFEWFHKINTSNETPTKEIDDLLLRSQKNYQSIEEAVKGLQIPYNVGILEILFKGVYVPKRKYEISEIKSMIDDLEYKTNDVITNILDTIHELNKTKKLIDEYNNLKNSLNVIKKLNLDLQNFKTTTNFYFELFISNYSDYNEIRKLLQNTLIYKYELDDKKKIAIVILAQSKNKGKILKTMRNFNANPFSIPKKLPQTPHKAYLFIEKHINEATTKQKLFKQKLEKIVKEQRYEILRLYETTMTSKTILETMRKPGGTKLFAAIQGYIPKSMIKKFNSLTRQWVTIVEDLDPKVKNIPTLFNNPKFVKTFEVITQSQGIPNKSEPDPTPMIAIMWPIFYGVMFADLGHGLLLMVLGLLFKVKGQGNLSRWGMLIAISGASASIAGVGAGEAFGFHIDHLEPFNDLLQEGRVLYSISWLVGIISVAELNFEQVITILKVSIFLGIVHLVWAFVLHIIMLKKEGKETIILTEALPNLSLYFGIVVIMMCAIGSGYDVMNMYSSIHTESVPWVTVFLGEWAQVWIVTRIAIAIVIASVVIMIIGGIKHAKQHPEEGSDPASILMEVLLGKTIECLAHTISYARIGIMLLVHAALLLTVNNAYKSLGGMESIGAISLIIGGNLGIMMIEGLIVYIQSLRLHLYEFFTKWYSGGSQQFNKIVPEMIYNKLSWHKSNDTSTN
ncbi:MAG: ATPase [Thaumarchaeota archaeon]|nr:ATPase [Nitrososphaerota archaeon]MCY3975967.1 ATPase [Nitrososphaerota archaeon]